MRRLFLIFIVLGLTGCTHTMTFTNFESGEVLHGQFSEIDRSVTVTMPNGEVLSGKYSALSNAMVTFGNTFAFSGGATANAFGTGITAGGSSKAYALLASQKSKLLMELIVSYSEWDLHGFGEARTNDGRVYKVQF